MATLTPAQAAVQARALELMDKHGLLAAGWSFAFDSAKRRLGYCIHSKRRISVSRAWADTLPLEKMENTILHEIAHALVGPYHGHDHVWRAKARSIGCTGERCSDVGDYKLESAWLGTCPTCKGEFPQHRAPQRVTACGQCSRTFNPRFLLEWRKNGEVVPMSAKYEANLAAIRRQFDMETGRRLQNN